VTATVTRPVGGSVPQQACGQPRHDRRVSCPWSPTPFVSNTRVACGGKPRATSPRAFGQRVPSGDRPGGGPGRAPVAACRLPVRRRAQAGPSRGWQPAGPRDTDRRPRGTGRSVQPCRGLRAGLHQPDDRQRHAWPPGRDDERRRPAGRAARRGRDRGSRLLRTQRGQGDARRPSPLHHHRRRGRAPARVAWTPRDPREPPRRLGHPVRDAHRTPPRYRRGRSRPRAVGRRSGRLLQGRPSQVRRLAGVPGAGTATRGPAPTWRPGHPAAVAAAGGGIQTVLHDGLSAARGAPDRGRLRRRECPQPRPGVDRRGARPARAAAGQRRRTVHVPARIHQPIRRAASADRPQT
jgi:hypothetical protein